MRVLPRSRSARPGRRATLIAAVACALMVPAGTVAAAPPGAPADTLPLTGLDLDAATIPDVIRTATDLLPPDLEVVRIVDIVGLDLQADGGTHVASTRQIGGVEVVKVENKGRGFRRLRVRIVD